jgi:hypothetical protein
VLGELDGAAALSTTAATLRREGVRVLDTHSPEPLDEDAAAGSSISGASAVGGVTAAAVGLLVTDAVFDAAPVILALAVLAAAVSTVLALVVHYWGFPRLYHPMFEHAPFTSTGFWVSVNTDTEEKATKAKQRLEALGAKNITVIDGGLW